MTYRDSNVGICDYCADFDAFIVGEGEYGNYCDQCEAIYQPEPKSEILWLVPIVFVGVTIGSLLHLAMYIATEVSR